MLQSLSLSRSPSPIHSSYKESLIRFRVIVDRFQVFLVRPEKGSKIEDFFQFGNRWLGISDHSLMPTGCSNEVHYVYTISSTLNGRAREKTFFFLLVHTNQNTVRIVEVK